MLILLPLTYFVKQKYAKLSEKQYFCMEFIK